MPGKNNYLKILLEITNKASQTYAKYQDYKQNPSVFETKEPQLFMTFKMVDKVISGTKERIEGFSQDYNTKDYRVDETVYISREEYYTFLECKSSDSNETIKNNYRRLVKDFHPDVIAGKDLPKPFIEFANKRFKEIHTAYEYIKKERNF